jgi:PIN domain nuclease of toxin-antitoxin system
MLLLDTHIFLWWLANDRRLGARLRTRIGAPATVVFVSAASICKMALGKLELPGTDPARLDALIPACGFQELVITAAHASAVSTLPPLHADPFDRLLIAQARAENVTLVSRDRLLAGYGVPILAR